jgi:hypothetical protein
LVLFRWLELPLQTMQIKPHLTHVGWLMQRVSMLPHASPSS